MVILQVMLKGWVIVKCLKYLQAVDTLCSLTCNFVRSQKYSKNNEIITYGQPLVVFKLETGRSFLNFNQPSFIMNPVGQEIKISLQNECDFMLDFDTEFWVTLHFQERW